MAPISFFREFGRTVRASEGPGDWERFHHLEGARNVLEYSIFDSVVLSWRVEYKGNKNHM